MCGPRSAPVAVALLAIGTAVLLELNASARAPRAAPREDQAGEQRRRRRGPARAEARRRGAAPILLLDEVTAHLAQHRRDALFEEIQDLCGQAWLSGTDRDLFAPLADRAQFVAVNGRHTVLEG